MSRTSGNHTLATSMLLRNQTDHIGRTLTEAERHSAQPWHPYWEEEAGKTAEKLRLRIGQKMLNKLVTSLPDEADNWPPQKYALTFGRILARLDSLPIGHKATLADLLVFTVQPLYLHPYEMARRKRPCPKCEREVQPKTLTDQGYLYSCGNCRNEHYVLDEEARQRWQAHVEAKTA